MSWPRYDPTALETATGGWWPEQGPPGRWRPAYERVVHRPPTPVPAVFPTLDLLDVAIVSVALLDVAHTQTALFYVSGDAFSEAVLDGEVSEEGLLALEAAHRNGPVTAYDKRAVVAYGRVQRYWPLARESSGALTFFVPPTVHGGDGLQFLTGSAPQWDLPAAVVLSARMGAPVLIGSQVR